MGQAPSAATTPKVIDTNNKNPLFFCPEYGMIKYAEVALYSAAGVAASLVFFLRNIEKTFPLLRDALHR